MSAEVQNSVAEENAFSRRHFYTCTRQLSVNYKISLYINFENIDTIRQQQTSVIHSNKKKNLLYDLHYVISICADLRAYTLICQYHRFYMLIWTRYTNKWNGCNLL